MVPTVICLSYLNHLKYIQPKIIVIFNILLILVSLMCILIVYQSTGIIPILADNPLIAKHYEGVDNFITVKPFVYLSQQLLSVSALLSLMLIFNYYNPKFIHKVFSVLLFVLIILLLLIQMKRGPLLLPVLTIAGGMLLNKRIRPIHFIMIFSVLLIVAMLIWSINRNVNIEELLFALSMSFGVEFRELTRITSTWLSMHNTDYALGMTYLSSLLSFMPSSVFPFKQTYHVGMFVNKYLGYSEDVLSGSPRVTYLGEAFLNFGFFGIIIISFLVGYLIKLINSIYNHVVLSCYDVRTVYIFVFITFILSFLTCGSIFMQDFFIFIIWTTLLIMFNKLYKLIIFISKNRNEEIC